MPGRSTLGSGAVDAGTFARNIGTHLRGVLLGSVLLGLLAIAPTLLLPPTYAAQSVVRVVPPQGQDFVDADSLDTAVEWYMALADVPSVLQQVALGMRPPMSSDEVREQTTLVPGDGPGEVAVRATSRDADEAVSLSDAMAEAVVSTVQDDKALQVGSTSLRTLLPAQPAKRVGTGPVALFVTGFLLGFALFATGAALLHRHLNWRLSSRMLESVGDEAGVPVITRRDELAAFLTLKGTEEPQAWLATTSGVPQTWWRDLRERMRALGGAGEVVSIGAGETITAQPAAGIVYVPDPNDGHASTVGAVAATGAPALLVCSRGQRARGLRRMLAQLAEFGVRPLAITIVDKDR